MKTNKKTMLIAALVVAVVACAGVGYAAVTTSYKATTTNIDNTLDSTYLTLVQSGTGAYTDNFLTKVYFDSNNTGPQSTTYTPVYNYSAAYAPVQTGGTLALISNILTLTVKPTNNEATGVNLDVDVSNFTPVAGLTYTMVLAKGNTTGTLSNVTAGTYTAPSGEANAKWSWTGVTITAGADTTFYVALFISGTAAANATNVDTAGFAPAETGGTATPSANKSVFTFTMTVPVSGSGN